MSFNSEFDLTGRLDLQQQPRQDGVSGNNPEYIPAL
jgi:hypothetical protein